MFLKGNNYKSRTFQDTVFMDSLVVPPKKFCQKEMWYLRQR